MDTVVDEVCLLGGPTCPALLLRPRHNAISAQGSRKARYNSSPRCRYYGTRTLSVIAFEQVHCLTAVRALVSASSGPVLCSVSAGCARRAV
jgi:hypothetical protein